MQKESNPRGNLLRNALFLLIAALIIAADQVSKVWIKSILAVGQSLPETGFPRLTHINNTGSAFGLFQGQSFALAIVAFIGTAFLLVFAFIIYRKFPFLDSKLGRSALGLILGGTIGNLIDRLRFGYVTDFIDVGFWPIFNIADSAAVIGTILFALSLLPLARAERS